MTGRLLGILACCGGLLAAAALSVVIGTRTTTPHEVFDALRNAPGAASDIVTIVWDQRIPRTALAVAVGASMALAGAATQGHTRNPLADPAILGVSAGAALCIVLATFVGGVHSVHAQVWFALLGATIASLLVLGVSSLAGGSHNPLSLVLAGAILSAFFLALTTAVILLDQASLDQLRFWSAGSLAGRDLSVLAAVAPFLTVGAVLALSGGPALNLMAIGTDTAAGLGIDVPRQRALGLGAVILLAGGATAAAGPIAFVGLIVPHMVRTVTGPDHRWLLPASALTGGTVLLLADVLGRVVVRPGELQAGIVLAVVGAPFFIWLVRRRPVAAA